LLKWPERRTLYRQFKILLVLIAVRRILCSITLTTCLSASAVLGQTFQPLTTTLVQEVAFNQANECYIYFDNPSGDTLRLKWRQLEISMPEGWDIDLCDYGTCYIGIPPNGNMNTVFDTIRPYLKLIVQPGAIPGAIPGAAWCWFRVQEVDDSANFADVYFSLFTPGTTASQSPNQSPWRVYPNPAREQLIIDNPTFKTLPGRLFDATGHLVWQDTIDSHSQTHIPLTDRPAGMYFLQLENQSRRVVVEK